MKLTRTINQAARAVQAKGAAGLQAASVECDNGGAAHITVAIKAGSRYETSPGVAAMLAAGRSLSSLSHTSYLQNQQLAHAGASLSAKNTRDHIVYTLTCGPKLISEMFQDVVAPAIFKSEMWQWELDNLERGLNNSKSTCMNDKLHEVLATAMGGACHTYEGCGLMAVPTSDPAATVAKMASLSEADIAAAKELAHCNASFAGNTFSGAVGQALSGGVVDYNVSEADVKALATKLSKGKKSLAVSGDLSSCPFVS